MRVCVLGSGSKGNCTCIFDEDSCVLIDDGLAIERVEKCLRIFGLSSRTVHIFVTHSHVDHVKGILPLIKKHEVWVYATAETAMEIECKYKIPRGKIIQIKEYDDVSVGRFTLMAFPVSHDVACVGYTVSHDGRKLAYATDLGKMTTKILSFLKSSDLVVLEANHDEDMLYSNDSYPWCLKNRISSDKGHLCNEIAAKAAVELAISGVKQLILAHLSEENNLPELAFSCVRNALSENGISEEAVSIEVALQDRMSGLFEIR